ncbi:expressed unknown protein [Seminavis robusta]|uniref:Uncharacterized protein n=1 Tax=Seminavis robusta TaxID=568900 RepID=A0A9N8EH04_9STRA|nr:expressed unknown protein [Seminavis robusta]|eukprot:Sro1066_g237350.1 n/a (219) ;mRNA; r:33929-34585
MMKGKANQARSTSNSYVTSSSGGCSMREDPVAPPALMSFLGNLLETALAKSQQQAQQQQEQEQRPDRHSFVIVSDNARSHPKHSRTCPFRDMDSSIPRVSSCPGSLKSAVYCCSPLSSSSSGAMPRVASMGDLGSACRWAANVDETGAVRPPLRTDDDDDEDFGSFVVLSDDEDEDDDGDDDMPMMMMSRGVKSPEPSSVNLKALAVSPTSTAIHLIH